MFGSLTGCEAGNGESVLILLHGIGGNAEVWKAQLAAFAPHHRTIAWNAPGYGGSSPFQARDPTLSDYANALGSFLDALKIYDSVNLLGHSMGGLVASKLAAAYPERVRRLVLTDCSSGHRTYSQEAREQLLKSRLAFDEAEPFRYARDRAQKLLSVNATPDLIERVIGELAKLRQPGFAHATRMISEANVFDHAHEISVPTQVLCGTNDEVTPEALNRRIAQSIPGAKYIPIPGAGHWSFLERPNEFNIAVLQFLLGEVKREDVEWQNSF